MLRKVHGRRWAWIAGLGVGLLLCLALAAGTRAEAAPTPSAPSGQYVLGEVLVRWQEDVEPVAQEALLSEAGLILLDEVKEGRLARLAVPTGREGEWVRRLGSDPRVAYAEPNYLAHACGTPNDPQWSRQWNMSIIQAPAAWDVVTGSDQVVVAFIDTGVDQDHPELVGRVLPGYDYVNGDNDPEDDHGHGTHATGIAAALGNNGLGVAGLNWKMRILPLKVLDATGNGSYYDMISAIYYASNQGARVMNLSLGGSDASQALHDAVAHAADAGALLVAAVGNQNSSVLYPAAYTETIAVAATDAGDNRAYYSNYGPAVDIAAPGGTTFQPVYSTWRYGSYGYSYGTSMAAPHVAGLAGLVWTANPNLSAQAVWETIRDTADKVGMDAYTNGWNQYLGYGRINAAAAILRADPPTLQVTPRELYFLIDDYWAPAPQGTEIGNGSRHATLAWEAAVTGGPNWVYALPPLTGTLGPQISHTLWISVERSVLSYGHHRGRVRVSSPTAGVVGSPQGVWVNVTYVRQLARQYLPLVTNHVPEPEGYTWFDAATGGTSITLGDDDVREVPLPFSFPFYGQNYSSIWVSANGFASFGAGYGGAPFYSNHCLPNPSQPNNAIYAFWDDLDPSIQGGVYYQAFGNDTFVVEWENVPRYGSGAQETFEIVLKSDGSIKLQYQSVDEVGYSTVGVENGTGTSAQQYLCNGVGGSLADQTAIWFQTAP